MNKFFVLGLAVILVLALFGLFGCNEDNICGNGICQSISPEISEENPNSKYYCPADCGGLNANPTGFNATGGVNQVSGSTSPSVSVSPSGSVSPSKSVSPSPPLICTPSCTDSDGYNKRVSGTVTVVTGAYEYDKKTGKVIGCETKTYTDQCSTIPGREQTEVAEYYCGSKSDGYPSYDYLVCAPEGWCSVSACLPHT